FRRRCSRRPATGRGAGGGAPGWGFRAPPLDGRGTDGGGKARGRAAGDNRLYSVQDPDAPETHLRGRFETRSDGTYAFLAVRPVPYKIPSGGPVGRMLAASERHPWRPSHIHVIARAPAYRTVPTHVFHLTNDYPDST